MTKPQGEGVVGGPPPVQEEIKTAGDAYDAFIRRLPRDRPVKRAISESLAKLEARLKDPKWERKKDHYQRERAHLLMLQGVNDGSVSRDHPV